MLFGGQILYLHGVKGVCVHVFDKLDPFAAPNNHLVARNRDVHRSLPMTQARDLRRFDQVFIDWRARADLRDGNGSSRAPGALAPATQTKPNPPPLSFPVIHHAPGPPPTPRGPRGVVRIQPIFPPPHTSAECTQPHPVPHTAPPTSPHLLPPPPTQAAESARARARNNHIILHPSIYPR